MLPSAELAILRATGWSDARITQLILSQGAGIGVLGGLAGAAAGVMGFVAFAHTLPLGLLGIAALCASLAVLLATAVAWLPAVLIRRQPVARLLAEEAG